jgi:hypothetical protein
MVRANLDFVARQSEMENLELVHLECSFLTTLESPASFASKAATKSHGRS